MEKGVQEGLVLPYSFKKSIYAQGQSSQEDWPFAFRGWN